jgi:hypothetical protein
MTSLRPPKPELDPARHWLVYSQYEETPDGVGRFRPITLDEAASRGQEVLETGSDDTGKPLNRSGIVVLPAGRATTIAGLLEELSLRLRPGLEVGPIQSDGSISDLARELAEYMDRLANP